MQEARDIEDLEEKVKCLEIEIDKYKNIFT